MGCCCSKKAEEPHQVSKNAPPPPPPPPPEEEMVKEVLSETPKPKPKPKSLLPHSDLKKLNENELSKSHRFDSEEVEKRKKPVAARLVDDRSEQPQPSDEACSFSEAASVATLTSISSSMATRERDEEETTFTSSSLSNNKVHKTSHYNSNNGNGNSRRAYQSQSYSGELVKKEGRSSPAVVVSGVGCRSGRASPTPTRSNNNRSLSRDRSGIKRDIGERSARRSISPGAKRRDVTGAPARRIPPAPPNKAAPATQEVGQEGKESLDNPSVSLECFIFL